MNGLAGPLGAAVDLERAGADSSELALRAVGLARIAPASAMPDQPMAEDCPLVPRQDTDQVGLDFLGVFLTGQPETQGEALDVGVDDNPGFDAKRVSEHDIGGFSADTCQSSEGLHGAGHFAAVFGDQVGATGTDVFSFGPEKTGGLDNTFQVVLGNVGVILGGSAALEEGFGDEIDPFVGALRRENGGNEEL